MTLITGAGGNNIGGVRHRGFRRMKKKPCQPFIARSSSHLEFFPPFCNVLVPFPPSGGPGLLQYDLFGERVGPYSVSD